MQFKVGYYGLGSPVKKGPKIQKKEAQIRLGVRKDDLHVRKCKKK